MVEISTQQYKSQQLPRPVEVGVTRLPGGGLEATNSRGARLLMSSDDPSGFTPVELLLAAIAGCTAIDVDLLTSRRAEPERFDVRVSGAKVKDDQGANRLESVAVEFSIRFPEGEDGDRARAMLPVALQQSHDRLCTVGRTVELGTPITITHD